MRVLLDTNVVVRFLDGTDVLHAVVTGAIGRLSKDGAELVVAPQVVFETWVVATRPRGTAGLGLPPEDVEPVLRRLLKQFPCAADPPDLLDTWLRLCLARGVSGKHAHDARIVAYLVTTGVDSILTLNAGDFTQFPEVAVLQPGV